MTNRTDEPDLPAPWGRLRLRGEGRKRVVLGSLVLHMEEYADEVRVAHHHREVDGAGRAEGGGGAADPHGDEVEWSRWATAGWDGELELVPAFPDRLVVVEPEDPFHLLKGAEARVYLRVALWVQLRVAGVDGPTTLMQLPTVQASDTWFGSVEEGELGYWLSTKARRTVSDDLFVPHLAVCPLQLVNRSETELPVDRIALRVEYLSLYRDGSRLWSDETRVRYAGDAEGSRLEMAGRPPSEAPGASLCTPPRTRMGRGFTARTFARFLTFQGWS